MRNHEEVYSIILVHNNADVFPTLYRSIQKNTNYPIKNIIIDNGSTDRGVEYMDKFVKKHGDILLRLPKNMGVTVGWNLGLRYLRSNQINPDLVAFINSDIEVGKDWLEPMIKTSQKFPLVGMVDNVLCDPRMRHIVQSDGPKIDTELYKYPYRMSCDSGFERYRKDLIVEWGTMACCLFRYGVFEDIGLFDENFFVYSSDIDIQIRMRQSGYKIAHCISSEAYHKCFHTCEQVRANNPEIAEYMVKDGEYLKQKWGNKLMEQFQFSKEWNHPLVDIYGEGEDGFWTWYPLFPERYEVC